MSVTHECGKQEAGPPRDERRPVRNWLPTTGTLGIVLLSAPCACLASYFLLPHWALSLLLNTPAEAFFRLFPSWFPSCIFGVSMFPGALCSFRAAVRNGPSQPYARRSEFILGWAGIMFFVGSFLSPPIVLLVICPW